jgi:hypothetical protein
MLYSRFEIQRLEPIKMPRTLDCQMSIKVKKNRDIIRKYVGIYDKYVFCVLLQTSALHLSSLVSRL